MFLSNWSWGAKGGAGNPMAQKKCEGHPAFTTTIHHPNGQNLPSQIPGRSPGTEL
jgi:hypothetical protein